MADDWKCSFLEQRREFTAELRPASQWLGVVSGLGILGTLVTGAICWALSSRGLLILVILLVCVTAFSMALWLGLRRSFWRITLDFESKHVCVEEQRSFDTLRRFDSSINDILLEKGPDSSILLRWRSDDQTKIQILFHADDQANRTLAQLQRWLQDSSALL